MSTTSHINVSSELGPTIRLDKGKGKAGQLQAPKVRDGSGSALPALWRGTPSSSQNTIVHPQQESGKSKTVASKMKQRRVSTSALPILSGEPVNANQPGYNWPFRDEMGISSSRPASSSSYLNPPRTATANDSPSNATKVTLLRQVVSSNNEMGGSNTILDTTQTPLAKRQRRNMWTEEETKHLIDGCNTHGVGSWKKILDDPHFHFQDRNPVDLKDRFRVSFPEEYRKHYPNAKTHLSSRTASDGSPVFEKTRQKRRAFSTEEDEALYRGYEQHGTVWSTIVKDPVFQSRRPTDLRDRFRNAWPDLYAQAGYKPRQKPKKPVSEPATPAEEVASTPTLPETDRSKLRKQRHMSEAVSRPVIKLRRAAKSQYSVDPNTPCSETEDDSSGDEEILSPPSTQPQIVLAVPPPAEALDVSMNAPSTPQPRSIEQSPHPSITLDEPHSPRQARGEIVPSQMPTSQIEESPNWLSTPTSPSSSEHPLSTSSSTRIGNSVWGSSWLSPSPRLDSHHHRLAKDNFLGFQGWPSIPEHGVFDRYDLYSGVSSFAHDISSDSGDGNRHSHANYSYLDPAGAFPGFTHHHYAGDLISGAGVLSGPEFEFVSTTSGTSLADVGQANFQDFEDDVDVHDTDSFAFGIEDSLQLSEDAMYAVSVERPRTVEPGSIRAFDTEGPPAVRRPSTAVSSSNALQLNNTSGLLSPSALLVDLRREDRNPSSTEIPMSPFTLMAQRADQDSLMQRVHLNVPPTPSRFSSTEHSSPSFETLASSSYPSSIYPASSTSSYTSSFRVSSTTSSPHPSSSPYIPPTTPTQLHAQLSPSHVHHTHHHHHRSSSQPPRESRSHVRFPTSPVPFSRSISASASASTSFSPFDAFRHDSSSTTMSSLSASLLLPASTSSSTSLSYHAEPLSTAALDLHYGTHIMPSPGFAYRTPNVNSAQYSNVYANIAESAIVGKSNPSIVGPSTLFGAPNKVEGHGDGSGGLDRNGLGSSPDTNSLPNHFSTALDLIISANKNTDTAGTNSGSNTGGATLVRSATHSHLRGQSATVSPGDLTSLGIGGYKKRKRASWDGRPI